jgi:hypothetical protein
VALLLNLIPSWSCFEVLNVKLKIGLCLILNSILKFGFEVSNVTLKNL